MEIFYRSFFLLRDSMGKCLINIPTIPRFNVCYLRLYCIVMNSILPYLFRSYIEWYDTLCSIYTYFHPTSSPLFLFIWRNESACIIIIITFFQPEVKTDLLWTWWGHQLNLSNLKVNRTAKEEITKKLSHVSSIGAILYGLKCFSRSLPLPDCYMLSSYLTLKKNIYMRKKLF